MTTTSHSPAHSQQDGPLARMALRFTAFTEKWLPDAFGFVLVGTVVVLVLGLVTGEKLLGYSTAPTGAAPAGMGLVDAWGQGFWSLITFTLQMAMIIIGGYAVAVSAPMARVISRLAGIPSSPRAAVVFVAVVAMLTSYLNWAFSLVFTAILAKEVARLVPRADYRALGAMAFLGLGTVWAQGLSGSAALQVASKSSSPTAVQDVIKASGLFPEGIIPLNGTIFTWRAIVATLVVFLVATTMAWFVAPSGSRSTSAQDLGITLTPLVGPGSQRQAPAADERTRPGDFLENTPWMTLVVVALAVVAIVRVFARSTNWILALDLNMVNLVLLMLAAILHWHPMRLVRAVTDGSRAASGVLLQFPFYGGIFGMIAYTGLSKTIAGWLTSISNQFFYPPLIALYSCVLGIFVPSGGSKWVIEAPYVLSAANTLKVDPGWMVVVYDLGEASANLLQPFWMLPTLAVLGLRAKDIMGYTFSMFLACFPAALVAVTLLAPHVGG